MRPPWRDDQELKQELGLARISHKGIRSSPSWHDNWWPESNLANLRRTSRPEHCVSDGLPAGGLASCSLPVVSAVQPVVLCTLCEKCGLTNRFEFHHTPKHGSWLNM